MKYSPAASRFYSPEIDPSAIPEDAFELSGEAATELLEKQRQGWTPRFEDGAFVFYAPDDPPMDVRWRNLRRERNKLLQQSDWTQGADAVNRLSAETIAEWVAYRQALADITLQDINNIIWPTPPN